MTAHPRTPACAVACTFDSKQHALPHCRILGIVPNVDQITRDHAPGVFLYESSLYVFSERLYVISDSACGRVEGV